MKPRLWLAVAALATTAQAADEKKPEPPLVTAVTPLRLVAGETQTVRLRGVKLKDVTEIRCTPTLTATVKEKKDASLPAGLEAKEVGDQELVIEVTIPADWAAKTLSVAVVTPTGTTGPREIAIGAKDAEAGEKEPNNGFREAQLWDGTKPLAAKIDNDKDVDVFRLEGRAGKSLAVSVVAAKAGSLLDPVLTFFDADGRTLTTADDTDGGRDARVSLTPKADGPIFVAVNDAHDRGGSWHAYRLEMQP